MDTEPNSCVVYCGSLPLPGCLAAALHLGHLPLRCPADAELMRAVGLMVGGEPPVTLLRPRPGLHWHGRDAAGRLVASLGTGAPPWLVEQAVTGILGLVRAPAPCWTQGLTELNWQWRLRIGWTLRMQGDDVRSDERVQRLVARAARAYWCQAAAAAAAVIRRLSRVPV